MMPLSDEQVRFFALQSHWVTATSIDHHLSRSLKVEESFPSAVPEEVAQQAIVTSGFAALSVWYSLLYVVIEGYIKRGYQDEAVDALLTESTYVSLLCRFRNATFHYQKDPQSTKLLEFLQADNSSRWVHNLKRALADFFLREMSHFPGLTPLVAAFFQT